MNINYQVADSAIGRVLVATTERGVCAVSIGDDSSELVSGLHAEYPAATIHADTGDSGVWIRQIVDYLDGRKVQLEMPLDVAGTAFQWQVWQALRAIPFGSTRTYHEIATAIGNPNAARAVGHACATNPVALVIPCHRAVRAGGGLGGYRWGLDRKRKLLAQEALRQPFMTSNQAAKPV